MRVRNRTLIIPREGPVQVRLGVAPDEVGPGVGPVHVWPEPSRRRVRSQVSCLHSKLARREGPTGALLKGRKLGPEAAVVMTRDVRWRVGPEDEWE